jgi:hypothetical protein
MQALLRLKCPHILDIESSVLSEPLLDARGTMGSRL